MRIDTVNKWYAGGIVPKNNDTIKFLYVNEMFTSISGEVGVIPQGQLVTVLRLQGCNLSCNYCDASDSQGMGTEGQRRTTNSVVKEINKNGLPVLITGGEPLLQVKELITLILGIDLNIVIQIETNGTKNLSNLLGNLPQPKQIYFVMDYKFDNPPDNSTLEELRSNDYLKFVVSSLKEIIETFYLIGKLNHLTCKFAVSATDVKFYDPILKAVKRTDSRTLINVQIHKFIGVQ